MFLQRNSAGWEKDKKKHSKTDNHVKLKGSKCHLLEESTSFSVNILLKYIFAVKEDVKCIYSDLPLILLSMYNNDHQDGGSGLILPQIQKLFLAEVQTWFLCTLWECSRLQGSHSRSSSIKMNGSPIQRAPKNFINQITFFMIQPMIN